LWETRFHDCTAAADGGGVSFNYGRVTKAEFWRCRAERRGGAFYHTSNTETEFDSCDFHDCRSKTSGSVGYFFLGSEVGSKILVRNCSADSPYDFVLDDNKGNHPKLFQDCTFRRTT
jgi:hypothetical protein